MKTIQLTVKLIIVHKCGQFCQNDMKTSKHLKSKFKVDNKFNKMLDRFVSLMSMITTARPKIKICLVRNLRRLQQTGFIV